MSTISSFLRTFGIKWLLILVFTKNLWANGWRCRQGLKISNVELFGGSINRQRPIFSVSRNEIAEGTEVLREIEKYWQKFWENEAIFATGDDSPESKTKPKFYLLSMIPYPSGDGLHVGHLLGYTAIDAVSRYKRMKGYEVLNPIGWDSFGLPAERYAKEVGRNVEEVTRENIDRFRAQLKSMGYSYDWTREISTSDPDYYKWTQWTFQQFFLNGLAYRSHEHVNWCPELDSVLANEEVRNGKSIRGSHDVYRKPMEQWMLRITKYAKRLVEDLKDLDWPQHLKVAQEKWIGLEEGYRVGLEVLPCPEIQPVMHTLHAFTLDPCMLRKCKAIEVSIYTDNLLKACPPDYRSAVAELIEESSKLTNLELAEKRKIQFTGRYALNPLTGANIPIYVTNGLYGFNKDINARLVVDNVDTQSECSSDDLKKLKVEPFTNLRFRDWIFSRQRNWGEPIPIFKETESGNTFYKLAEKLPVHVSQETSKLRNTNETMPQWAGSCWHYLRFVDPRNSNAIFDKAKAQHWLPVDLYIGGAEHSVSHLLYSRFWNKVLYDLGISPCPEPFKKIILHGTMNRAQYYDKDGKEVPEDLVIKHKGEFVLKADMSTPVTIKAVKMSKSKQNVVKPDDIIETWSADALRLHLTFLGPIEKNKIWSDRAIVGVHKLLLNLVKFYKNIHPGKLARRETKEIINCTNGFITHITRCLETVQLNTSVQGFFKFFPEMKRWYRSNTLTLRVCNIFLLLLNPFAPHISEELWHYLNPGNDGVSISQQKWPEHLNSH
ncbi:leucyl-tRNA synthetase, putative [Theileria equi strain WA]|uniref:leucine--tRNA ligase n=1 Tax=Theileria equi strain WA TaxID=1537102 RepID=L1LBW8_THEEQ|nr:leucyl-tRNA synthetase, putative [Theileria equi strain WA]EKX72826.1 leucyl-tRNA synthetase, putative [Theileria equi strain WA]|eukprot:XP_004832278.1 leucyl-tRNA synthetase, putative [Theileria equi strain WA]